jgi:hypothetical protein
VRRLLAFLVLFGVGVGILYWLEQSQPVDDGEEQRSFRVAPTPSIPEGAPTGVGMRGRFELQLYDLETSRTLIEVESLDSRSREQADELEDVTLHVFDPEKEESNLRGRILAKRARIPRGEVVGAIRPEYENRVFLEEVEATFEDDLPITGLVVRTPEGELDATTPGHVQLLSEAAIALTSRELDGGGRGYHIDVIRPEERVDAARPATEDVFELTREGWLEFRSDPAVGEEIGGRFAAIGDGPVQVRSAGRDSEQRLLLEGWEGTRLELAGERPALLEGEHMLFQGSVDPETDALLPTRLDVDGDVQWTAQRNFFTGQVCAMDFDETGAFARALLTGFPTARIQPELDPERIRALGTDDLSGLDTIRIASDSEIELIQEGDVLTFRVAGPATLEGQGLRLRSNGELTGSVVEESDDVTFRGTGGVVVEGEDATLETAEISLSLSTAENGRELARGTASGGARLVGTMEDGRPFAVTSPDLLEIHRVGESFRVVEGRGVEVSVEGENGFFARCDRLTDLDFEAETYTAEGDVVFRQAGQSASAHRLVAAGPGRYTLWGEGETKAVLVSESGRAEAMFVDVDGDHVHAKGGVRAVVTSLPAAEEGLAELTFDRYELDGEDLVIDVSRTPSGGVHERTTHVEATGDVRSVLLTDGRRIELRKADSLTVDRRDRYASEAPDAARVSSAIELNAHGSVDAHLELGRSELDLACDRLDVSRTLREGRTDEPPEQEVTAQGNVRFSGMGMLGRVAASDDDSGAVQRTALFSGEGERLRFDHEGRGRLEAPELGRVKLLGVLPTHELPFRLIASRADFSSEEVEALNPEIVIRDQIGRDGEGKVFTEVPDEAELLEGPLIRARGNHLVASRRSLEMDGDVRLSGTTERKVPWILDSQRLTLEGNPGAAVGERARLSKISAHGGVTFQLGDLVVARSDSLFGGNPSGVLRLSGDASIETPVATTEAEWIEFDPELQVILATGRGAFRSGDRKQGDGGPGGPGGPSSPQEGEGADEEESWTLEHGGLSTRVDQDSLVLIFQEPVFHYENLDATLRASWVVLWIDRKEWEQLPERVRSGDDDPGPALPPGTVRPRGPMRLFFDFLEKKDVPGLVREAYFEGPIQILNGEDPVAHADAVYFDLTSGHGWLANATIFILGRLVGQDFEKLTIKANWLRHSADGSLRANRATVTPCSFEEPHLEIVTGDLRLQPLTDDLDGGYEVDIKENRIQLYEHLRLPLPAIGFDTDEDLKPRLPSIRLGRSARFGQLFEMRFTRPAKKLGRFFHRLFSGDDDDEDEAEGEPGEPAEPRPPRPPKPYKARYDIDASYLGSRGGLVDLGFRIESPDRYYFDLITGVVYDTGRDKGYVRVPEDDRDDLRLWLRSHGEFRAGKSRVLFAYSDQSDPAVQSEFYESEFTAYEEAETFVQWKRADGHIFTQASVVTRVDEFRAEVEELPSLTAFRGRAPIGHVGKVPVLHTGDFNAEYLRRRRPSKFDTDGDGITDDTLTSPFGPSGVYPDGTKSSEVVRLDSTQRFETPLPLGMGGLKLTPFGTIRGTAWSRATDEEEATRVVAGAGARLSAMLWKRSGGGGYHQLAPYVSVSREVASEVDGTPVVFDSTETAISGDFIKIGTRSRFGVKEGKARFDLDVNGTYASDRSDGLADGWLPIGVFSRLGLEPFDQRFDVWYDGRFDSESGETVYSLFSLGTRVGDRAGFQIGHQYGRDSDLLKVFDAATVSGFYRWTEKWEFEGRQAFSLLADERLGFTAIVRRYGHDLVFELESEVREGEGSAVSFGVKPRFAYRPSRIGYINW